LSLQLTFGAKEEVSGPCVALVCLPPFEGPVGAVDLVDFCLFVLPKFAKHHRYLN
jgi:hypothetical protein